MGRALPMALGLTALLSTMTIICVDTIIAVHIHAKSSVRKTSIASASLEAVAWAVMGCAMIEVLMTSSKICLRGLSPRSSGIAFGCAITVSMFAAAASVANIICLGQANGKMEEAVFGASKDTLLITSSAFVCMSVICQVGFLTVFFVTSRRDNLDADSLHTIDRSVSFKSVSSTPSMELEKQWPKAEPYHTSTAYCGTRPTTADTQGGRSFHSQTTDAMSLMGRNRSNSWDRYSSHSRNNSNETPYPMAPKACFLETIPASPTVLDKPALEISLISDLTPPPPVAYEEDRGRHRPSTGNEAHIHPLFRSDSPNPPPIASAGTRVIAAPDAGKVIQNWPSNQSLRRMRSASQSSSHGPLSRSSSIETSGRGRPQTSRESILEEDEEVAEIESPQIPDYVRRYTLMQ